MAITNKSKREFTTGEVLKLTGLSKKELQALDELGILQPEARMRQGIHLYDDQTLMRIAQFTFYEALEVPLEVTREILANSGLVRPDAVLDAQLMLLYTKQDALNTRIVCIEAAQTLDQAGFTVPWAAMTRLQHKLPAADLNFWNHFQPDSPSEHNAFRSFDLVWSLYQTWKRLLISAAIYEQAKVPPEDQLTKSFGLQRLNWQREVDSASPDLKDIFEHLETTEQWLRKPPFEGVFAWLRKVELGL